MKKQSLCFLLFALITTAYADKRYAITGVTIRAALKNDGSMIVQELRTYDFSGSFRYAYRTFSVRGDESFSAFQVSENGIPYRMADTEAPGTFQIITRNQYLEIRWFYEAKNERRTFTLAYQVNNLVQRYEDAAVLYYQFIGPHWDHPQHNVTLQIVPPIATDSSRVRHWLHGPLWAQSGINPEGTITAECAALPRHTYLEIRALYPTSLFSDVKLTPVKIGDNIVQEEAQWSQESNQTRKNIIRQKEIKASRQKQGYTMLIPVAFAALMLWYVIYQRYGQRPPVMSTPTISSEIPENAPPAFVGYLLNYRMTSGFDLVATLYHLADRGFLNIREVLVEKRLLFGSVKQSPEYSIELNRDHYQRNRPHLQAFEQSLIDFIFAEIGHGADSVTMEQIKKARHRMTRFFNRWQKQVKHAVTEKNYYDRESIRGMSWSLGLSGLVLLMTIAAALWYGLPAIVLGATTVAVFVLSFFIAHRTSEGERIYRGWKALKKYLTRMSFQKESAAVQRALPQYFIYGPVLGLQKKHYQAMTGMIPHNAQQQYFPWYYGTGHGSGFSAESFAASFTSMITTMSSPSGMGGGASSGGGGGAGGGGGGAG